MSRLDAASRSRALDELADGAVVDVLVVGGGITGAGVALDAASRGLSVALVERRDLATGTSRWSSKLVHGGLRYLASGDVGIAFESARERHLLLTRVAPHLVRPLPMLLPSYAGRRAWLPALGLRAGDVLRAAAGTSGRVLPRARRVSAVEATRWVPGLDAAGLASATLAWDGQLEDDARLVVAVARTAASYAARVVTYCTALALDGSGARVRDELTGAEVDVRARHVVNATGVWAGGLSPDVALRPSRGAHLVVPLEALGQPRAGLTVPVAGTRNRFALVLPHPDGYALVGLTDTPSDEPPADEPAVTADDEAFLLDAVSGVLARPLTGADVIGRFAGLRPLLADPAAAVTADVSRRHRIVTGADGVITVVGGKLTTYRRMAQQTVDRLTDHPCRTARLPLVGAGPVSRGDWPARLARRYGGEAPRVAALGRTDPALLVPVAPGVPVLGVELAWGVTEEGALTVDDLLDRRTRLGLVPAWRAAAEPLAAELLASRGAPG